MPLGKSRIWSSRSCFSAAHLAIAVGPLAPANTAIAAVTTTLTKGCRKLTAERGSSNAAKYPTTSSRRIRTLPSIARPPGTPIVRRHGEPFYPHSPRGASAQIGKITQSARWPWVNIGLGVVDRAGIQKSLKGPWFPPVGKLCIDVALDLLCSDLTACRFDIGPNCLGHRCHTSRSRRDL